MTSVRKYKISFIATDTTPTTDFANSKAHDNEVVLEKVVNAVDRKSAEKIAKGFIYEWMFEAENEISPKLEHANCIMGWEIKCLRQPRT